MASTLAAEREGAARAKLLPTNRVWSKGEGLARMSLCMAFSRTFAEEAEKGARKSRVQFCCRQIECGAKVRALHGCALCVALSRPFTKEVGKGARKSRVRFCCRQTECGAKVRALHGCVSLYGL